MMWLWHFSHWKMVFYVPSLESGQAYDHGKSDSIGLLKLDHTLSLLWMLALGTLSPCCEEAQVTTLRDHCSSWQLQLRAQPRASVRLSKTWASELSDVKSHPSFESSQQRAPISQSRDKLTHCALSKSLIQTICESKKMVAVLCHLVWMCSTTTVNHYNCFKAAKGLQRSESAFPQKANLTAVGWLRWDPVGGLAERPSREPLIQYAGFLWHKPKCCGRESLYRGDRLNVGVERKSSHDFSIWTTDGSPDRIKFLQKRNWFLVCREEKVDSILNILNILNLHDVKRI